MTFAQSISRQAVAFVLAALIGWPGVAGAEDILSTPTIADCSPVDPDSVQISWDSPCTSGSWLFEPTVGCRMWDWHPTPSDVVTWTGDCRSGTKVGSGVVQWFEHDQPIDRFEGTFVSGRRRGPGRYTWNSKDWFVGFYEDDLPNGIGTASIAGQTFAGQWHHGCFARGALIVAIGIPRKSCDTPLLQAGTGL